jgi:tetratricopeptide (TPR) repeat protein
VASPEKTEEIFAGFPGAPPLFYRARTGGVPVYRTSPNRLEYFNPEEFPVRKPPGGIRIFVFGGSTAYGEPWGNRGSFSHVIEERAARGRTGRALDVVNVGGKGYGSTAILSLVREALRYDPDAFLFYTGQNEIREATFHPLEREGRSTVPAWRALLHRHSRVYGALREVIRSVAPRRPGARPTSFASREVAAILSRPFGPGSFSFPPRLGIPPLVGPGPEEERVFARFEENLRSMLQLARNANVPCFVLTQVRNEQYWLVPNRSRLAPGAQADYERRYVSLLGAADSGRAEEALALVDSVAALYASDDDTYLHVLEGDLARALGDRARARSAYRKAWSADPANERIRAAAAAEGAVLVECEPAARGASPDSILGFDVFYDELHPTPSLHGAIAEAAWTALAGAGLAPGGPAAAEAPTLPEGPDAEVLAYEALRAMYTGQWSQAEMFAERAAALAPDLGKAHVYLGICATRRGDLAHARAAWDRLAALYPEYLPAR